jgi:hypothetical protein
MADKPDVHIGENTPEYVAYRLMEKVLLVEGGRSTRESILNTYAECLIAVKNPAARLS